jgi:predicted MFS family arabinose efflux permease
MTTGLGDRAGVVATLRASPPAVRALLLGTFVNKFGGLLQIFLVIYLVRRGFSVEQAGLALGAYGAGVVGGVLLGGWLCDAFGARRTIIVSMLGSSGLTAAVLYVDSFPAILVTVAAVALVGQAYRPASTSLLALLTPDERPVMVFALYRFAFNLGTIAGPLLGSVVVQFSYPAIFWIDAATAALFAVIAAIALPRSAAAPGAPAIVAPSDVDSNGSDVEPVRKDGGYLRVLADRRFTLFLVAMLINTVVYAQYLSALPLAVRDAGLSPSLFGVLVSINGMVVVVCELAVTTLVQRWAARLAVTASMALLGLGMTLYAVPLGVAGLVVATLIWSFGETVGAPTTLSYPARIAPQGLRGRYLASVDAPVGIGFAIGPPLGAVLWPRLGAGFWYVCGAAMVVAVALAYAGVRPEPDRDSADELIESR